MLQLFPLLTLSITLQLVSLCQAIPAFTTPKCKSSHLSPSWPDSKTWATLNTTLEGALLAPDPPAVVCDQTKANTYDLESCRRIDEQWSTAPFHDADPVLLHHSNWQDNACLPPSLFNGTCETAPFAKYVVNASEARYVQQAVNFASENNLMVTIKNTGHDYLGRSTSPGFQIWTHHLKGIEVHSSFQPQSCQKIALTAAVTVHSGNQFGEIYKALKPHNVVIAGGEEPGVGIGGHLTGGGHSPLGSLYGLIVDHVLEMTVVTPGGELVTANECQNADLFWAMKGGGGSTFGVLITATLRTHPDLPAVPFFMSFTSDESEATDNNNENFYSLLANLHTELINWTNNHVNGYMVWGPTSSFTSLAAAFQLLPPPSYTPTERQEPLTFVFGGHGLNHTASSLQSLLNKITSQLNTTAPGILGTLNLDQTTNTSSLLRTDVVGSAGYNARLSSRLWDRSALLNRNGLMNTYHDLAPNRVLGLAVSGPGVHSPPAGRNATSATPTWEKAYLHVVAPITWELRNENAEKEAKEKQMKFTGVLAKQGMGTGVYLNEADGGDDDYDGDGGEQWSLKAGEFWGEDNYSRLLEIKRKVDPKGVFWCRVCVGREDWRMDPESGQLCRI